MAVRQRVAELRVQLIIKLALTIFRIHRSGDVLVEIVFKAVERLNAVTLAQETLGYIP
jgi:hypothetical protein